MADTDDGKMAMIKNVPHPVEETLVDRVMRPELPEPVPAEQPPGTTKRRLNVRERNLLIGACRARCTQEGHTKLKDQDKLNRIGKLVKFEETLEYIAMITDWQEEHALKWERDWVRYKAWRRYQEGLIQPDDEKFPKGIDLEKGVPKPPLRVPENTPAQMRGPERDFYFPSKLDAWAQDAVKEMDWSEFVPGAEYTLELSAKFGVEIEG